VKVVEELAKHRTDFKVLVVGSDSKGKFLAEVQSAIKTNDLEQFFVFLGTRSDIRELYSISDVSLSLTTTTAESFGRAVVESIAVGTPVIAYAHGAVAETMEVLAPELTCAVKDQLCLVKKIDCLLNDNEPSAMSFNSFTLAAMKVKTLQLYAHVVSTV
jgi:glycosyltransferase involved in cell wall biosynthesis